MKLPENFIANMKNLLGKEFDAYLNSFQDENFTGLRLNTLKLNSVDRLKEFNLSPIFWCKTGFYYKDSTPGKHPYHNAGLYYIQEPSAMSVVELADVKQNELVLDLCASPGGKSTQIACKLNGTGLLVSNEIIPNRAKVLSENIERMGISQSIVTNETPQKLASVWGEIFDKVFVDAPCSGEGMFRKDIGAITEWNDGTNQMCHLRQMEILESADKLVSSGGTLIYSTCTFSPFENEKTIDEFLKNHHNYHVEKINHNFDSGNKNYIDSSNDELNNTIRIFPHHVAGEGHFIAVLKKDKGNKIEPKFTYYKANNKMVQIFEKWQKDYLNTQFCGKFVQFGDNLYIAPNISLDITTIKVLRYGLHLGDIVKGIFTPSHSLALALKTSNFKNVHNVDLSEAISYLKGNTLQTDLPNGWCVVALDGFVLGFGKVTNGTLKNHYPKGLRI